ncbi:MAG: isoquinoline 1-oxidoreductase beta subunit [Polaribacter sp.]|jgi:isoquinoline 1-oxidoreductase beta subunit
MTVITTKHNRRSFLRVSAAAGGGMMLGFSWLAGCKPAGEEATKVLAKAIPSEWFDINAFLKIGDTGLITIFSPNPEIGQNIKTSMPMIVAEELDVAWKDVVVEQAPLNSEKYQRQVAGGSQSIRKGWQSLRMAGATARQMLVNAAAKKWEVPATECTTKDGMITNSKGESISYGEIASATAGMEIPTEIKLKDPADFKIIGTDTRNVDIDKIITGEPLFGIDTRVEGMQYACVLRPPAFGQKLVSFDDAATKTVNGVNTVLQFGDKVAVLANSTWAAMKGKKALTAKWKADGKMESTAYHNEEMLKLLDTPAKEPAREDGDIKKAFAEADQVIEKTYEAPFLPHNCLEPMNFYANVTPEKVELVGPIQTPAWTQGRVAKLLERDPSEVTIDMTRMGGGFGRRLYGDFTLEAAEISSLAKVPVQLMFSREDDMTAGTYRPASKYKFRASVKDGKITGYHLTGTGTGIGSAVRENNFPAGAIPNYLVESHNMETNITTGAWRAPITNFLAFAEQAFFDEVAHITNQDAVQLRLNLFEQAKTKPATELEYDADKSIGVIKLAAEKANWGNAPEGRHQGFSTYYSHNTYVAEVAEVEMKDGEPVVKKVICVIDCGIVVNPIAALNQVEGGIIDGIGHAMYGELTFVDGKPQQSNFNNYRMIRMGEQPEIEVHFVKSTNDPTGLGEPTLPPAGGAIANAIHAATGKRLYKQPFVKQQDMLG